MGRYYGALHAVVEAHRGTVVKLLGDGVMAAFGLPRVAEDDALRAVRAAVAMQQALRAFARDLLRRLVPNGACALLEVFEGARDRDTIVGLFSALLELVKQGLVRARQDRPFGAIAIALAVPADAALARFAEAFPGEETPPTPGAEAGG